MFSNFVTKLAWKEPKGVNEQGKYAWVLHFKGSSNRFKGGAGIILKGLEGVVVEKLLHFGFQTTNNQAKYVALIARLNLVKDIGVKSLTTRSNS